MKIKNDAVVGTPSELADFMSFVTPAQPIEPCPEVELLPLVTTRSETYYIVRSMVRAGAAIVAIQLVVAACLGLSWLIFTLADLVGGAL